MLHFCCCFGFLGFFYKWKARLFLYQRKDHDSLYRGGLEVNWQYLWGMLVQKPQICRIWGECFPKKWRLSRWRNSMSFCGLSWDSALSSGFWSLSRTNTKMLDLFQTWYKDQEEDHGSWHIPGTHQPQGSIVLNLERRRYSSPPLSEVNSKTPSGCPKPRAVPNPICAMTFPIHTYIPMIFNTQTRHNRRFTITNDKIQQL